MDDEQLLPPDPGATDAADDTAAEQEGAEPVADLSPGAAPDDDDGGAPAGDDEPAPTRPDPEVEHLRAKAAQFDQVQAYLAQQQAAAAQQQAEQYWVQTYQQGEAAFQQAEQQVYAQAEYAPDPVRYIRDSIASLSQQRQAWQAQYYQAREQQLTQFAVQQMVPQFAAQVAAREGLDVDGLAELLTYPPELMPREARRIRARTQQARSMAARQLAGQQPGPGNGRGAPGRVQRGSRNHLLSLWQSAQGG